MSEKLGKWYGCALGGLRKEKRNLASEIGAPVARNGEEVGTLEAVQ